MGPLWANLEANAHRGTKSVAKAVKLMFDNNSNC